MTKLSGDPYAGACRAYHVLNPNSTSDDWERWLAGAKGQAGEIYDDFEMLGKLCRSATDCGTKMDDVTAQHVAYSAGFFEAMGVVASALLKLQPSGGA